MSDLSCRDVRSVLGRGRGRHRRVALNGLSFTVESGEVVGIVGMAGSGKTTLLRILGGDCLPSQGIVTLDGIPLVLAATRRQIGYVPDPPLVPPELRGIEWLAYLAAHHEPRPGERSRLVSGVVELSGLGAAAARRAAGYDRGEMLRLAIAGAALTGRRLVVLDETLTGCDPVLGHDLRRVARSLAERGRIVVIASRDVGALERVATRAIVLSRGRVVADVSMATLLQERVAELALNGGGLSAIGDLLLCFRGAVRTGEGLAVPLVRGRTLESVLSACRVRRVAVSGSRVRFRTLEDILVVAARQDR